MLYPNCAYKIRLFRVRDLLRTYTTCALEATYAHEYGFARKVTYCVRTRFVLVKQLVCTSTALHLKRIISYVYGFARKATYAYEVRILRVK